MKIITCASFYGSGSSALTDLVAEYSDVYDMTNYEFRFLHDLDGVSDLEYHLIEGHNRHNSGHALKRFLKLSRFNHGNIMNARYEPFFDNKYYELTKKYVEELTEVSYNGWWFYDLYDKGVVYYYYKQLQNHFLRRIGLKGKGILKKEVTLCSHPTEEKFLDLTRDYVAKLMEAANKEKKEYLELDQIVPSQNINRVLRYFKDDIYVFVIDRDPRDLYVLERFYWKEHVIPTKDVNEFCDWFLYVRNSGKKEEYDKQNVIQIHFEDLVYNYDKILTKIEEMTGLNAQNHINQFKKFNPKRSVNNTRLWEKYNIHNEISIIEERLDKYLYSFDEVRSNQIAGELPEDISVF